MELTTSFQLLKQERLGLIYGSNKYAYLRLYGRVSSSGPDIANNQTKVYLEARLYSDTTWYSGKTTYYRITGSGDLDSGNVSCETSASNMWAKGESVLGSVSRYIEHNDDGTRTIHAEAQFVSTPWGWNVTASATDIKLPTIPRASSVSCSSENIGDTHTITIGKKATAFTNTVTYKIGALTGTIAEKTSETVLQLDTSSLKQEIYALIPNAKKISGTITCTTYSGDTQIGSPTTATFNLYAVEEDCKPIVSGTVVDTNEKTIALTGFNNNEINIEWNGDITGRDAMEVLPGLLGYYKVSDEILEFGSTVGGTVIFNSNGLIEEYNVDSEEYMEDGKKNFGLLTDTGFHPVIVIVEPTENYPNYPQSLGVYFLGQMNEDGTPYYYVTGLSKQPSSKLVRYMSKPKVTITATPQLSSTIKSYSINLNDGQTASEQEYTFDTINSNKITVNVTDSRGYSNPYDVDLTDRIVDYVKLHFNSVELLRPEGTSNEVILDCDGVWFNGNFSEETSNTLKVSFLYRLSGKTEWIDGGEITPTIDGNKFSFNDYSLGNLFDYNSEYQFKIIATDLLMTVGDSNKESIPVPKGQEVWFECEDGIGVYGHIWKNDIEVPIAQSEQSDSETDTYSCDYINELNDTVLHEEIIYNQKIYPGDSIELDMKKYKRLIINFSIFDDNQTTNTGGANNCAMLDLTNNSSYGYKKANVFLPYIVNGVVDSRRFVAEFTANEELTQFYFCCWFNGNLLDSSDTSYYVSSIIGQY